MGESPGDDLEGGDEDHAPASGEALQRLVERLREAEPRLDERVWDAMRRVDRALFVPQETRAHAYEDVALPIGYGQTISAPHMVALMADRARLAPGMRVLEVGTGSGYNAAILGTLVGTTGEVCTFEVVEPLSEAAGRALGALGMRQVRTFVGDDPSRVDDRGDAPGFDRIVVTAAAPSVPDPWLDLLRPGGRIVIPVDEVEPGAGAGEGASRTWLWIGTKAKDASVSWERDVACRFVPLTGRHGIVPHGTGPGGTRT